MGQGRRGGAVWIDLPFSLLSRQEEIKNGGLTCRDEHDKVIHVCALTIALMSVNSEPSRE